MGGGESWENRMWRSERQSDGQQLEGLKGV